MRHCRVEVGPAEPVVAIAPHDVHIAPIAHVEDAHVKRPPTEIVNHNMIDPVLLIQTVGQRCRRGLFEYACHSNTRIFECLNGGDALFLIEFSRDSNDG
mmetsp:Transcript_26105/g.77258  ORF Transcript_26105/g.77258 Transcript_26105/m.77258 type:complete len:99 (+) Transcript_26105:2217-2513(+)